MKTIKYLICSLFVTLQACSSEELLDLGSQTKEEINAENSGGNKQVQECKDALTLPKDGWKMVYEPEAGKGTYTFFFQFQKDGLVNTDSDLPEKSMLALYDFVPNADTLIIAIKGGAHFRFLNESAQEEELIVKSITADRISCIGRKHGKTMDFVKTTTEEVNQVRDQKKLLVALQEKKVMRGVMRNNGSLVAHYVINYAQKKVNFTFIKDGIVQHATRDLVSNGNAFTWSDVVLENTTITGLSLDGTKLVVTDKNGSNTLALTDNSNVLAGFDSRDRQYQLGANIGVGDAIAELYEETKWDQLVTVELNFTMGKRPFVACLSQGYLFYDAVDEENGPLIAEIDKVTWTKLPGEARYGTDQKWLTEGEQKLSKLLAAYFDKDGYFIIKENAGNDIYYYMLSTTGKNWFKVKQSR